jgi:NADH:ubiquinone oxidoreductase subunit F (NADH-binding)
MCEFCESLKDKTKEIIWSVRSSYADDNMCEFVNDENCQYCNGCKEGFVIDAYDYEKNTKVDITYFKTISTKDRKEVKVHPFSESIQWNFCPICGKQISNKILDFEDYYSHQICIYDKED